MAKYLTERPNTVSGLLAKRTELTRVLNLIKEDERRVMFDINHIDAAIRLFDPKAEHPRIDRYPAKFRARRGEVLRLIVRSLKAADGPLTTEDILQQHMEDRGLLHDHDTTVLLRKRLSARLSTLKQKGVIRAAEKTGRYNSWELVR